MKGLLLKDFYMTKKYCMPYIFIGIGFFIASIFSDTASEDFIFNIGYPFVLIGMIPVTLIAYDERERWSIYSAVLPYSKKEIVTSKYLIGLLFTIPLIIMYVAGHFIKMCADETFSGETLISLVIIMSITGIIMPSLVLPFIFKLGAEKGRIAYFVALGIMCALLFLLSEMNMENNFILNISSVLSTVIAVLVVIGVYILSWVLSVKFYEKREI